MKVLCVGTRYPPDGRGGYEQHCQAVVGALGRRGHDVRVLTGAGAADAAPRAERDVHRELVRFPPVPRRSSPPAAWRAERHNAIVLEQHLDDFRPDVVCWWRMGELSLSLVERVADAGVPAVGVVCDPWMVDGPRRDPWSRLRRRLGRAPRLADAAEWLFVSNDLHGRVAEEGVDVPLAGLAPPGVDPGTFAPREALPPWRGELLYAGRLSRLKGVDTAIAALEGLPTSRLTVMGDGDEAYRAELEALAHRLHVADRVAFRPGASRDVVAEQLREADCVLFPVRWAEPFGLVPLEAMSCGVPVVASGRGGSADYLDDGENAVLAPPDDPVALARAVARLADDDVLRARLVAGGRATAAAHDEDAASAVVVERLEAAAA